MSDAYAQPTTEPYDCERCGATYDETSGDGYCGLCPRCADETEPEYCGSCEAALEPQDDGFPFHLPDDDCRAVRTA